MARFKYRTGSESEREAAAAIAGGDLKGSDFREAKRGINRQRRQNRRAMRKAKRFGAVDPTTGKLDAARFGYEEFTDQEKAANEYFKDLHKGRTARIAGGAALAAGAVLAAPAIGAALAGKGAAAAGTKVAATGAKAGKLGKIGAKIKTAGAKLKPVLKDVKKVQGYADAASNIIKSFQPQQLPSMPMPMPQVNPMDFSQFYGMPSPEQFNSMAPPMPTYNDQMYQNVGLGMAFPQFQTPNPYLYQ